MGFLKVLKGIGKGAKAVAPIAGLLFPQAAPVIGVVVSAVTRAETEVGPSNGARKALLASQIISDSMPAIIALLEKELGRELVDENLLQEAIRGYQEDTVKFLNAFGGVPTRDKTNA